MICQSNQYESLDDTTALHRLNEFLQRGLIYDQRWNSSMNSYLLHLKQKERDPGYDPYYLDFSCYNI